MLPFRDAEDHIKIVFKGVNGRLVDMEISGGVSMKVPEYMIYGTRGTLVCEGRTIKMKYIDPEYDLPEIKANPETPAEGSDFGSRFPLPWKEETIELTPNPHETHQIWDAFYDAYRLNKPYPITSEQAMDVVKVLEDAKIGTEFAK